ncbi:MAG: Cysteine-tRNA ligase [Parcubacteria group bacterium GW2011_GWC2_42_6]|nr:MAG: Cysteine-tRNA ligase [Parcubacteria group bacterium GW2011_GWC2_42_6]KKT76713.1 MAG: Cysteine-tRNA ligase [Parcubacteria group bacterium GW2011_GWF2_44_7]
MAIKPIYFYNTLTRQKEEFKPLVKNKVGFYACGPTVYNYPHIGNLRSYVFEDILRRVLEYNGYQIRHIMNITDVGHLTSDADTGEDKIEKGAKREGKTPKQIADFYTAVFKNNLKTLNIKMPDVLCRASEHIKEQISLIKILEKKGYAYRIEDGIYFDTSKDKDYGYLARLDITGLRAGARVETVPGKKNITDFALWKFTPKGAKRQQEWHSPWGVGFPGWHLECSAMSHKYLSDQFDIHCGGIDHIPVHHTNEIAQSQAAFGKIPARFWLHNNFLVVDGEKMAKSAEDFLTLDNLAKTFNPLAYRYLLLTAHYRSKLNLVWKSLSATQTALNNLYETMTDLNTANNSDWRFAGLLGILGIRSKKTRKILKKIEEYDNNFLTAVNDDLDTPKALSVLWQLLDDQEIPAPAKRRLILKFDKILGLNLDKVKKIEPPGEIKKLAAERELARQKKDWAKADSLRAQIEEQGWIVEDTDKGLKIKIKR